MRAQKGRGMGGMRVGGKRGCRGGRDFCAAGGPWRAAAAARGGRGLGRQNCSCGSGGGEIGRTGSLGEECLQPRPRQGSGGVGGGQGAHGKAAGAPSSSATPPPAPAT